MIKWFLNDEFMGAAHPGKEKLPAHRDWMPSVMFYCPKCGDVWARVETEHKWTTKPRMCPKHGPGFLAFYKDKRYALPEELLKREIDLMLSYSGDYESHLCTGGL